MKGLRIGPNPSMKRHGLVDILREQPQVTQLLAFGPEGKVVIEVTLAYLMGLLQQVQGSLEISLRSGEPRQTLERLRDLGVIRTKRLLLNGQRALEVTLGCCRDPPCGRRALPGR